MNIEIDQDVTSVRIKIMVDPDDWRSEVAYVSKRWEWRRENGPLFADFSIEPALARTFSGSQDGQNPVSTLLRLNICNAVAAHLAYQLDELFKTQEDFKRPIKVVQHGPVFFVEWAEEGKSDEN